MSRLPTFVDVHLDHDSDHGDVYSIKITDADGNIWRITPNNEDEQGLAINFAGMRISSGIAVLPRTSNDLRIVPAP
jgi:hypothetical protein